MDDFYGRHCEKNIWWKIFCTGTLFFWKMRIKLIPLISVDGRFGQQLICASLRATALLDASRTEQQGNRHLLSRFRKKEKGKNVNKTI
jgi:hypothetical protein